VRALIIKIDVCYLRSCENNLLSIVSNVLTIGKLQTSQSFCIRSFKFSKKSFVVFLVSVIWRFDVLAPEVCFKLTDSASRTWKSKRKTFTKETFWEVVKVAKEQLELLMFYPDWWTQKWSWKLIILLQERYCTFTDPIVILVFIYLVLTALLIDNGCESWQVWCNGSSVLSSLRTTLLQAFLAILQVQKLPVSIRLHRKFSSNYLYITNTAWICYRNFFVYGRWTVLTAYTRPFKKFVNKIYDPYYNNAWTEYDLRNSVKNASSGLDSKQEFQMPYRL